MMLDMMAKAAFASFIFEGSILLSNQQPMAIEAKNRFIVEGEKRLLGNRKDTYRTSLLVVYVLMTHQV